MVGLYLLLRGKNAFPNQFEYMLMDLVECSGREMQVQRRQMIAA